MSEPDSENAPTEIIIARWTDRFFAWVIDNVIIYAGFFGIVFAVLSASNFEQMVGGDFEYSRSYEYSWVSLVFFFYWFILESKTGQSIGKMALHLKITDLSGNPADLKSIAISSFGKALLLPLDVIIGRLFTNQKRQRIFNNLGKTIVIKVESIDEDPKNVSYKKD